MNRSEAYEYRKKIEKAAEEQNDVDALESIELFPKWKPDIDVVAGKRFQYNSKLYRCVQSHRTQDDWTPDITPALWTEVSVEDWPQWRQPTGSQDSYMTGDRVTYNEDRWISSMDYNVYVPGVYGWDKVS